MGYCEYPPRIYASLKLPAMRSRWNGQVGAAVRQLMPGVFPGVPAEVGVGITANSMGATETVSRAGFWEIGWYNIPAGPLDSPPPRGMYLAVAQSDTVRALIGRSADVSSSWASDTLGQVAVGLVAYADVESRNVVDRIPEDLRPRDRGSIWNVACAIMGYVSGGSAASAIRQYAQILRRHDERTRFHALAREVAREAQRGERNESRGHAVVRAMQRLQCGKALAVSLGNGTSWWYSPPDEVAIEHWATVAWQGQPQRPDCVPQGSLVLGSSDPPASDAAVLVAVGIGVVTVGVLGWLVWRRTAMQRDQLRLDY